LAEAGAANVELNDPIVDEATVAGEVVTTVPSYLMVIVEEAAKPVPVTVIVVPTAPIVGLSVIEAITENVVEADSEDASVAVTVCAPKVDAGVLNDAEKRPELSVVTMATVDAP